MGNLAEVQRSDGGRRGGSRAQGRPPRQRSWAGTRPEERGLAPAPQRVRGLVPEQVPTGEPGQAPRLAPGAVRSGAGPQAGSPARDLLLLRPPWWLLLKHLLAQALLVLAPELGRLTPVALAPGQQPLQLQLQPGCNSRDLLKAVLGTYLCY